MAKLPKWQRCASSIKKHISPDIQKKIRKICGIIYSPVAGLSLIGYYILPFGLRKLYCQVYTFFILKFGPLRALRFPPVLEDAEIDFAETDLAGKENEEILVHYSGGADCSLAAATLSRYFKRVRLITFKHQGIVKLKNCQFNVQNLKKRLGEEKFTHEVMDMSDFFSALYLKKFHRDVLKHPVFGLLPCGPCRFAMHLASILYCKKHGIKYVSDGSHRYYGKWAPAEMVSLLKMIRSLYEAYGIGYIINPCYRLQHSDILLKEMAVVAEDRYRSDIVRYRGTQASCPFAPIFLVVGNTIFTPYLKENAAERHARNFYAGKIKDYKKFLDEKLRRENLC